MNLGWKISKRKKNYLGLQIEHISNRIFVYQSAYREKVLNHFYMDNAHTLSIPIVVWSLDAKKEPFRLLEKDEEIFGLEVPYLSTIETLMYLANCKTLNTTFTINLWARYSSTPTKRHQNGVKHILCYLRKTTKMRLFFIMDQIHNWYTYAYYLFDHYLSNNYKKRSQINYLFTYVGTIISWRFIKQILVVTSSNH
jgi:hypothetical protein